MAEMIEDPTYDTCCPKCGSSNIQQGCGDKRLCGDCLYFYFTSDPQGGYVLQDDPAQPQGGGCTCSGSTEQEYSTDGTPLCSVCGNENKREDWPSCQRDNYNERLCYNCTQQKTQNKCNKSSGGGCCGGRRQQEEQEEPPPLEDDEPTPPNISAGGSATGPDAFLHIDDIKKTVLALCAKVGVGPVGLTSAFP